MIPISTAENLIDNANWRRRTQLGIAVLGIDGQVAFDFLQMPSECSEFGSLLFIAHIYVCLEGCLVSEQFVVVGFIRADGDVDGGIKIHPGKVTFIVVV